MLSANHAKGIQTIDQKNFRVIERRKVLIGLLIMPTGLDLSPKLKRTEHNRKLMHIHMHLQQHFYAVADELDKSTYQMSITLLTSEFHFNENFENSRTFAHPQGRDDVEF